MSKYEVLAIILIYDFLKILFLAIIDAYKKREVGHDRGKVKGS